MAEILIGILIGVIVGIPMFIAAAELSHRRKVSASQREYWNRRKKELGLEGVRDVF